MLIFAARLRIAKTSTSRRPATSAILFSFAGKETFYGANFRRIQVGRYGAIAPCTILYHFFAITLKDGFPPILEFAKWMPD
jgi:hypothetical protein